LVAAPEILDISPMLPSNFQRVDAASKGMSKADMRLGSNFSEVELFVSEEPSQMIYCFLGIIDSRLEQINFEGRIEDENTLKSLIAYVKIRCAEENVELSVSDIEVTYPDIGDWSVLGEGHTSVSGMSIGFDMLWFRINNVYVCLNYLCISSEEQSLVPIAGVIERRIVNYQGE